MDYLKSKLNAPFNFHGIRREDYFIYGGTWDGGWNPSKQRSLAIRRLAHVCLKYSINQSIFIQYPSIVNMDQHSTYPPKMHHKGRGGYSVTPTC